MHTWTLHYEHTQTLTPLVTVQLCQYRLSIQQDAFVITIWRYYSPTKDKTYNKCSKICHFANKCRLSNRSQSADKDCCRVNKLQQSDHDKVQEQPHPIDDNFDDVDWLASIHVSYYLPTKKATYEARNTILATIHNIQQRSQVFTTVHMVPEDKKGKWTWCNAEVGCKVDTDAGANVMLILF